MWLRLAELGTASSRRLTSPQLKASRCIKAIQKMEKAGRESPVMEHRQGAEMGTVPGIEPWRFYPHIRF